MKKRIIISTILILAAVLLVFAALRWRVIQSWETRPRTNIDEHFKIFSSSHSPTAQIPIENIHSVSKAELTDAALLLPQSHRYNSKDLRYLYNYSKTCKAPPSQISNELQKALTWTRHLCGNLKSLNIQFFNSPPYMHPAGYSYAFKAAKLKIRPLEDLYPYIYRAEIALLDQNDVLAIASFSNQNHWIQILAKTEIDSIDQLGKAKMWVIGEQYVFHRDLSSEKASYQVFERKAWDAFWHALPLHPKSPPQEEICSQEYQDLCWIMNKRWDLQTAPFLTAISSILLSSSIGWIIVLYIRRKRSRNMEQSERLLMLQLLTHELRTPVTTMGLDIEMLRKEISTLSSESQVSFLRINSSVQRLFKALKASQAYLATFTSGGKILDDIQTVTSINNFVTAQVDSALGNQDIGSRQIQLKLLEHDTSLSINTEILGVCIRNLVENAKHHGKGSISIQLEISNQQLNLQVKDEGMLDERYLAKSAFTNPFSKGNSSQGLGIGMFLVKTFICRLGGHIHVSATPTTFELIVPITERQST